MNIARKSIIATSLLIVLLILGYIVQDKGIQQFTGMEFFILFLIVIIGVIAIILAVKKDKELKQGLTIEDEMSKLIKYKAGYYAFLISMYMWLFIFLFKDKFPDAETMLGGGILLSALLSILTKMVIKRNFHA